MVKLCTTMDAAEDFRADEADEVREQASPRPTRRERRRRRPCQLVARHLDAERAGRLASLPAMARSARPKRASRRRVGHEDPDGEQHEDERHELMPCR